MLGIVTFFVKSREILFSVGTLSKFRIDAKYTFFCLFRGMLTYRFVLYTESMFDVVYTGLSL